jgi:nucleotide-binding universal stress UspA family protein
MAIDETTGAPTTHRPTAARRVMIATDGSEASLTAARVASELFDGGDFVLVTVIGELEDPMADAGGFEGPAMDEQEAETAHRADVVDAQGSLAATAHVFGAQPVREQVLEHRGEGRGAKLCAAAAEQDVDVLVVGSHGHGVLADALLGSISNFVVHHSDRPVLVVPSAKAR